MFSLRLHYAALRYYFYARRFFFRFHAPLWLLPMRVAFPSDATGHCRSPPMPFRCRRHYALRCVVLRLPPLAICYC